MLILPLLATYAAALASPFVLIFLVRHTTRDRRPHRPPPCGFEVIATKPTEQPPP